MKTTATKKPGAQKPAPKTNAPKKPTDAPAKGTKAKNTTSSKTNTASKSALGQAKAIEALSRQIEAGQRKLASLLNTTIGKVDKSLDITKTKLTKLAEQEKKNKGTLKACQANHKTKPNKLTEAALKKAEHLERDIAIVREKTQADQAALLSQLRHYQSLAKGATPQKVALKPAAAKPAATALLTAAKSAAPKPSTHKAKSVPSKKPAAPTKETPAPSLPSKEATGLEGAPGRPNA